MKKFITVPVIAILLFIVSPFISAHIVNGHAYAAGPTVSITSPANGSSIAGTTVGLAASASDSSSTLTGVAYQVDGAYVGGSAVSPYSFAWDSTHVVNGSHTITAIAQDAAGATGSASVTVTVSNNAPVAGTTYYIAANGSTSNSGTSASSPWPISKVGSAAFNPGDMILFNKGDTFTNVALNFTRSGSLGSPIVFDAYGTGNDPVLDGGGSTSSIIKITGAGYIKIKDLVFQNDKSGGGGVYLSGAHDILFHNNYFTNVETGVYAENCTGGNIVVDGNYALNMQGPLPRGQIVQFNTVKGVGNAIINNRLQNVIGQSYAEDAINVYMSAGTAASPLQIVGNWVLGGGPSSTGGGIMTGDNGGSYEYVANNILVNPGQYGLSISGGDHVSIVNNKVYASAQSFTNVGLYVWAQAGATITSSTVSGNSVNWAASDGSANDVWLASGEATPVGWSTNTFGSSITASILPNPLWTGSPWNTSGGTNPPPADTTAPTVSVSAPAANATVSGASVALTASASDNVGVSNVQFKIDGTLVGTADTASPYAYTWNTTTATNATHTIVAIAKDAAGNTGTSATVTVTVNNVVPDTTAPTVSVTAPAANALVSGSIALTASASDNVGVSNVQFKVDGTLVGTAITAAPYTFTWNTTTATNATHTITAIAHDAAGNTGTATTITVTVDNAAATITGISASGITQTGATIGWTTNKVASSQIDYGTTTSYGTSTTFNSAQTTAHSVALTGLTAGTTYHYHVKSIAANGMLTTSSDNTFTTTAAPDTTAPTVSVTAPAANATVSGSAVILTATASDNVGVANVQFKVDGTLVGTALTAAPYTFTWNTTAATNAAHTIVAVAKDAAGNTGTSATVTVTVNNVVNTAPVISAVVVSSITPSSAILTYTTDQATSNSIAWGTTTSYTGGNATLGTLLTAHTFTMSPLSANTLYHYHIVSTTQAGLSTTSPDATFTTAAAPDTSAPTVSITAPTAGSILSGSSVALTAAASDNVGVASVQFSIDGVATGSLITVAPYALTWNTTTATNANHTISAIAKDAAGNAGTATAVTVTVDNAAPVISGVSASAITTTGATIAWTTNKAANSQVSYGTTTSYGVTTTLNTAQTTAHSVAITGLSSGTTYHYQVKSIAANGIQAVSADQTFTTTAAADTAAPTVSVTAPTTGATISGSAVALTASASDNVGVSNVQFKVDGTLVGTALTNAPYTFTWNTTTATNGSHTIAAIAHDAAGNTGTSSAVTVTVNNTVPDTTAPTVSVTAPAANATVSGAAVALTATAADNVGVANVQFKVDGALTGPAITTAPYAFTWDTTAATNAVHTISAVAKDTSGNATASSTVSVTVNNTVVTPPTTGVYYISANGSTANTGTSASSPWPLSKVASTAFKPGDHVLFNKGDIFSGTITLTSSGSAGNPIVLDAYGTAAANPTLDGAGSATNDTLNIEGSYITVKDLTLQNSQAGDGVVKIGPAVHDVTISNNTVSHGIRGIYALQSGTGGIANLEISNNYISNISDVSGLPNGGGSCIQFNNTNGSGQEIANNECYTVVVAGQSLSPNVGDIISMFQSNGTAASPIIIHDNKVRGGASALPATGKSGLALGDLGGSYQSAYNNILINPGSTGAEVRGGTNINLSNNIIYSALFPYTSTGIEFGNYSGAASSNVTIGGNKINFPEPDGSSYFISNVWWNTGNAFQPANWSTNTANGVADTAACDALLPNPLLPGAPVGTCSGVVIPPVVPPVVPPVTPPSSGDCTISTPFSASTGAVCTNYTGSFITQTLSVGSNSQQVQWLQHFLNLNGFTVTSSGTGSLNNESTYFGTATRAAVKRFQASKGLSNTGATGPLTRAAIDAMMPPLSL